MTTHYNAALALQTADAVNIATYNTDVATKVAAIAVLTTTRDNAIIAGEAAAKLASTTVMPAAEATAVTTAEAALTASVLDLTNFKTTNAAKQTIIDNVNASKLALTKAETDDAFAIHRCVTPTQKTHYDAKIAAEKLIWGYDTMTVGDKKIFDDYILEFTNYHQDKDA